MVALVSSSVSSGSGRSRPSSESESGSSSEAVDDDDEDEDISSSDLSDQGPSDSCSSSAPPSPQEKPRRVNRTRNRVLVKYVQCKQDSVKEAFRAAGCKRAAKDYQDWDIAWGDTSSALFRAVSTLKPFQCVNHFPLMQLICRKDLLAQHLCGIRHACHLYGTKEFSFFPDSWVFPMDVLRFWADVPKLKAIKRRRSTTSSACEDGDEILTFIAKPRSLSKGEGIVLFQLRRDLKRTPETLKKMIDDRDKMVVQRFLTRPHLIDGFKWDMRVYVLITDIEPVTAYLYTDGLARFCTEHYEEPDKSNIDNMEMHLTNFAINCESENFEDTEDDETGSKRSLRAVLGKLESELGLSIWQQISSCVKKTLMAIAPKLQEHYGRYYGGDPSRKRSACFEILGFDFILTECLELLLLEVNSAPSFATPSTLDAQVKDGVLGEALELLHFDASAKLEHQRLRAQQLEARRIDHVQRRMELVKNKEENLKNSVGFGGNLRTSLSSTGSSDIKSNSTQADSVCKSSTVQQEQLRQPHRDESTGIHRDREVQNGDEDFSDLGPRATEHYVQIMPGRLEGAIEQEIKAAAAELAKSWRVGGTTGPSHEKAPVAGNEQKRRK